MISQLIKNDPERINIRPAVVFFSLIHLRRHIGKSTLLRKAGCTAVQFPGNTEIPQLEFPESGYKNILRLDISVDDILLLAVFQSPAEISTKLNDVFLCQLPSLAEFQKTGKILHPYINIPSDIIQVLHHLVVLYRNHMRIPPEIFHGTDFLYAVVYHAVEIFPD